MRFLRLVNVLSIDVALGAAALSIVLARLWNIQLPLTVPPLLAMIVWIIYTFDHIKDARDTKMPGLSSRRNFHRIHYRPLVWVSVLMITGAGMLLFTLPLRLVLFGAFLSSLVMAYYYALYFLKAGIALKEVSIAVLYTAGIAIGPLACGTPPDGFLIHILQLFLLALNNLVLFAWFDRDMDAKEGFTGIVHRFGYINSRQFLIILPVFQFLLAGVLLLSGFYPFFELTWMLMAGILILPVMRPVYWQAGSRYRIVGDALFFLPLSTLLLSSL